jgi:hypothetical protein
VYFRRPNIDLILIRPRFGNRYFENLNPEEEVPGEWNLPGCHCRIADEEL